MDTKATTDTHSLKIHRLQSIMQFVCVHVIEPRPLLQFYKKTLIGSHIFVLSISYPFKICTII